MKRTIVILAAVLALAARARAQGYVILTDDRRVDGTSIAARPDGTIVLTTASGQRLEFERARVKLAVAPKPPEIDQAAAAIQAKRYDDAIKLLRDIYARNRFFNWGEMASKQIGRVFAEKGDLPEAVKAYEEHLRRYPAAEQDSEWMWFYLDTLLQAREFAKLEPRLNKMVAEGSRRDAARAQILRGDVRAASNQLEAAVLDYLRAVMFYSTEKDIQPQAMLKTAATLELMRDPRAKDWYRKLVKEFPASAEAAEAKKKL